MKLFLALALLAVVYGKTLRFEEAEESWETFKSTHKKVYKSVEEEYERKAIYAKNLEMIQSHNVDADLGKHSFWLGINQFADMTNEEYRKTMLGYKKSARVTASSSFLAPENTAVPDTVDWRSKGYVTEVKNQGSCGSCWAFSTTGSLEGQHFRQTGKLVSLSEQDLVDCAGPEGNAGCGGGEMNWAFEYIKKNHGIDTEECYPYEGRDDKCHYKAKCVGATVTGYVNVTSGDENALKQAVASVGPISVAIDASSMWFQFYRSGVYDHSWCSSTQLDHGVLAVGYGTEAAGWFSGKKDYWLVKNSWGGFWGSSGYIKMVRNKKNQCGVATDACYPLV